MAWVGPYPPIEIDARSRWRGGVIVEPRSRWGSLTGMRDLTVLVHGYNNGKDRADDVWAETHAELRKVLPAARLRSLALFYWPGDKRIGIASQASYFAKVGVAVDCGQRLADLLRRVGSSTRPVRVRFVGHSLGCRVVLEAVRALANEPRVLITDVVLMAAAVPEGLCESPRLYGQQIARRGERVLFSSNDRVLARWFRSGQWLARRAGDPSPGPKRDAVGLRGGPDGRWRGLTTSTGLDHCDYWTSAHGIGAVRDVLDRVRERRVPTSTPVRHSMVTVTLPQHRVGRWG